MLQKHAAVHYSIWRWTLRSSFAETPTEVTSDKRGREVVTVRVPGSPTPTPLRTGVGSPGSDRRSRLQRRLQTCPAPALRDLQLCTGPPTSVPQGSLGGRGCTAPSQHGFVLRDFF